MLYSGGDDGKIKTWSFSGRLQLQQELISMETINKNGPYGIRSQDVKNDGTILIGTRRSEIYEVTTDSKSLCLLHGHYDGDLYGLAENAHTTKFATVGGDKTVRVWDAHTRTMLHSVELKEEARAIDWSSDGQKLVVGTNGGVNE